MAHVPAGTCCCRSPGQRWSRSCLCGGRGGDRRCLQQYTARKTPAASRTTLSPPPQTPSPAQTAPQTRLRGFCRSFHEHACNQMLGPNPSLEESNKNLHAYHWQQARLNLEHSKHRLCDRWFGLWLAHLQPVLHARRHPSPVRHLQRYRAQKHRPLQHHNELEFFPGPAALTQAAHQEHLKQSCALSPACRAHNTTHPDTHRRAARQLPQPLPKACAPARGTTIVD